MEAGEDTDFAAVYAGYISVTPLHLDLTSYEGMKAITGWERDSRHRGATSTGGRGATKRRLVGPH